MNKLVTTNLIVLLTTLLWGEAVAQNAVVDSLLTVLRTAKEDTNKVNALNDLSKFAGLHVGNFDTARYYAENAKLLAERLKFEKGRANAYNLLGLVHWYQGNYTESLRNHSVSLRIREKIGDKRGIASSYNNIGLVYDHQGVYPEALKNYLFALRLLEELKDKNRVADCYNNIGSVHSQQGNYPEALSNYFASLRIREEIADKRGMAASYGNIGIFHHIQGNYPEAIRFLLTSLQIIEELGDKESLALLYINIGSVHSDQGNYQEALRNYLLALKIKDEIGDRRGAADSYLNIGNVYAHQNNYPEAIRNHLISLKIKEEIGDREGVANSYNNIGEVLVSQGKGKEALEWLQKGLALNMEIGKKQGIRTSYHGLAQADSLLGNYKGAYEHYKMHILYRDSLLNEENTKKNTQLEMQYEFDKKEAATKAEQDKKDAIASEQLRRKNQQRNAFIGGFALTLGLAGVSYRSYRRKKRDNKVITAQKQAVEEKNHAILESINYARRLQEAVLPPPKVVKEFFNDSFLLYLPRDIVSGDFYWMESSNGISYFAVGDCTGHGVPGAMLSVMGLNGLNRALNELKLTQPKDLLIQLTKDLHDAFERNESTVRDGMDIALCALNTETLTLTFCGANNPLWVARAGEMLQFKPNKRPVGHYEMERAFEQETIQLQPGDIIYLHSDGYQDQLGGPDHKKYMTKRYREFLLSISTEPMPRQRELLIAEHNAWKGTGEQTDDVCVMGVRV